MDDQRRSSPAVARNTQPILDVLAGVLPKSGLLLEIASGTGEHAIAIARAYPDLRVQPSDPEPAARASIAAWVGEAGLLNLLQPIALDVSDPDWPTHLRHAGLDPASRFLAPSETSGTPDQVRGDEEIEVSTILCINMVHISAWAATEGLFRGAARLLNAGAPLYLYGPYLQDEVPTAPSNLAFDADLKARNPAWGLRRLEDVTVLAAEYGFTRHAVIAMPANNLSVVFRRSG